MKPLPFTITVLVINVLFFLCLIWWIWFTLQNFSLLSKPLNDTPPPIESLRKTEYSRLYPSPKPSAIK